jgi:uncharacterized membrane protein (DUF4010 family)
LGYLLRKKFGKSKGLYLCGFLGGIMSSTLTNHLLTEKSKTEHKDHQYQLVIGNILAFIASIIHMSFFIALLSIPLLIRIIPGLIIIILTAIIIILILRKGNVDNCNTSINIYAKDKPDILLFPAIKFALIITCIKIISGISLIY